MPAVQTLFTHDPTLCGPGTLRLGDPTVCPNPPTPPGTPTFINYGPALGGAVGDDLEKYVVADAAMSTAPVDVLLFTADTSSSVRTAEISITLTTVPAK